MIPFLNIRRERRGNFFAGIFLLCSCMATVVYGLEFVGQRWSVDFFHALATSVILAVYFLSRFNPLWMLLVFQVIFIGISAYLILHGVSLSTSGLMTALGRGVIGLIGATVVLIADKRIRLGNRDDGTRSM